VETLLIQPQGRSTSRGVNLVENWGGGRWQTAFGSKLLTRKTDRAETSDTVEDKNKNVYIITGHVKLKHICAIFGGGAWRISYHPHVPHFGGVSPLPLRDLRPCNQWCSPRDQGLGLEAPRGQKHKSWSWSWSWSWQKSLEHFQAFFVLVDDLKIRAYDIVV